jgi:hypothetical protein
VNCESRSFSFTRISLNGSFLNKTPQLIQNTKNIHAIAGNIKILELAKCMPGNPQLGSNINASQEGFRL